VSGRKLIPQGAAAGAAPARGRAQAEPRM